MTEGWQVPRQEPGLPQVEALIIRCPVRFEVLTVVISVELSL